VADVSIYERTNVSSFNDLQKGQPRAFFLRKAPPMLKPISGRILEVRFENKD